MGAVCILGTVGTEGQVGETGAAGSAVVVVAVSVLVDTPSRVVGNTPNTLIAGRGGTGGTVGTVDRALCTAMGMVLGAAPSESSCPSADSCRASSLGLLAAGRSTA